MTVIPCPFAEEMNRSMAAQPSPEDLEKWLQRGIALKVEGNYEAAEREFKAVLEAVPDCASAHHQLGLVFGFTGLFDESLDALKRSVELDGAGLQARNDLALTYTMLGMLDEAK